MSRDTGRFESTGPDLRIMGEESGSRGWVVSVGLSPPIEEEGFDPSLHRFAERHKD